MSQLVKRRLVAMVSRGKLLPLRQDDPIGAQTVVRPISLDLSDVYAGVRKELVRVQVGLPDRLHGEGWSMTPTLPIWRRTRKMTKNVNFR